MGSVAVEVSVRLIWFRPLIIQPELGGRFYDEIERFIREVRPQPDRFLQFDPPVRRHLSTVFPYAVVFEK